MALHLDARHASDHPHFPFEGAEAASPPAVALRQLDWDTDFFGARMGAITFVSGTDDASERRAETLERDIRTVLAEARAVGYAHLIYRASSDDLPAAWAAERVGMRLVDVGIDSTYAFGPVAPVAPDSTPLIRPFRAEDVPSLRELAAGAFTLSRFSADPFFSDAQVQDFHRQWVTNLCAGLAQAVLVCELDGEPTGFVSCAMSGDEGRIPLIAAKSGYRRRGIGRGLVDAALGWFAAAGARVAHVKTQAHNYPALALYHRAGFVVTSAELTFSIILSTTDHREGDQS